MILLSARPSLSGAFKWELRLILGRWEPVSFEQLLHCQNTYFMMIEKALKAMRLGLFLGVG